MRYGEQIALNDEYIYSSVVLEKKIIPMFSTKPLSQWHEPLGTKIANVLHPDFFVGSPYNNNADVQKFITAMDKNSLAKYAVPTTPVKLYHSKLDEFVPYQNSVIAKEKWGKNVTLIDLTLPGHLPAGAEFLLRYMGVWDMIGK